MKPSEGRLKYRKKGGLAWRELTAGAMPDHNEVWEVQSPDGSIALLSRSDAPLPAAPRSAEETDSFHLEFAQQGMGDAQEPAHTEDLPVFRIGDIGKKGPAGAPVSRVGRPTDLADPKAFGVLVEGGDLEPKYAAGQVLLVDPSRSPAEGEWAVVAQKGGEACIGRWRTRGAKVRLEFPRTGAKPLDFAASEIRLAHPIIWSREP
jgi:hypothetical protein